MAQIPSYSPSISYNDDVTSVRHEASGLPKRRSLDISDEELISTPQFYYSQGNYESYFDKLLDMQRKKEELLQKSSNDPVQTRRKLRRKKECTLRSSSTSYIARRDRSGAKGRYVIKISIHEPTDSDRDCSDSDDANVRVQYIVHEPYDDVMEDTQALIRKISNKLE